METEKDKLIDEVIEEIERRKWEQFDQMVKDLERRESDEH